jgi:glycine/D-amino acid oxidase-like deaminating enzyme
MAVKKDTVIVGGGQAGFSLSAHLTARDQAHVVLERDRVGERGRSERWDSLHTLTRAVPKPVWRDRPSLSSFGLRADVLGMPLRPVSQGSRYW